MEIYVSSLKEKVAEGVVCKVVENEITVACEQWTIPESEVTNRTFGLVAAGSDVTYRRLQRFAPIGMIQEKVPKNFAEYHFPVVDAFAI